MDKDGNELCLKESEVIKQIEANSVKLMYTMIYITGEYRNNDFELCASNGTDTLSLAEKRCFCQQNE